MTITLDEEDIEQSEQIQRRMRCADLVMVCQESQLVRVEEVLGFEDAAASRADGWQA